MFKPYSSRAEFVRNLERNNFEILKQIINTLNTS